MISMASKLTSSITCFSMPKLFSGRWHPQSLVLRSYATKRKMDAEMNAQDKLYEAAEWHRAPRVEILNQPGKYGVFWGDDDPMNTVVNSPRHRNNQFHTSLDGVILALRQAVYERNLSHVIIYTDASYIVDCANRHLKVWSANGYKKKDGTDVKNILDLKDLENVLSNINVKFEKVESCDGLAEKLKNCSIKTPAVDENGLSSADHYEPNSENNTNVIFVHGAYHEKNNLKFAAYGVHFPDRKDLDFKGRMAKFPFTLLRAQMYGIMKALQYAQSEGMRDVSIVTDSGIFMKFHKKEWKKNDGTAVANEYFYKEIIKLANKLNAKFRFLDEKSDDPNFQAAALLAQDGLGTPCLE